MRKFFVLLFLLPLLSIAQKKQVTLDDIYKTGTFRVEYVAPDFGKKSTDPPIPENLKDEKGKLIGKAGDIIYSEKNPRIVVLRTNVEYIYRRSSKADVYVYDSLTKKAIRLDEGKLLHPTLSPDGKKLPM